MKIAAASVLSLLSLPAFAHHGIAGVGAASLNGPGAPIESATSTVLPEGKALAYFKVDDARYKTYDWAAPNAKYARYTMLGLGYGVTSWFSAYAFVPYHEKIDETGGLNSRGVADMSVMGQVGFKYDDGFKLVPDNESLDDLEDWHFSVFAGGTLPTGDANHRLDDGTIDPGKSLGFGEPSYSLGISMSKMLTDRLTLNMEASTLRFRDYTYDDGQSVRFGAENRFNTALSYRGWTLPEKRFRLDPVIELQYLSLGRDKENGVPADGTGGQMVYAMPGVRAYWQNMSFALGVKKPVWTRLNERGQQQGAEGKEKYRLIFSASLLF
ncbi:transporter [Thiobacillus sp.]|uniref:transporter n=1 Tax=Thiobacillus sp. TaxID=924 RepID=UPI0025DD83CE|nr:transporter [Thiobacillus sp.]